MIIMERRMRKGLGGRPVSREEKRDGNLSKKQREEGMLTSSSSSRVAMKQKVIELLNKSRRLKRDITKVLISEDVEQESLNHHDHRQYEEEEDSSFNRIMLDPMMTVAAASNRTGEGPSLNECDLVDLVLGDSLASTDLRNVDVSSSLRSNRFSSSSSDDCDEFSDDDPLRNESIIERLFYGGGIRLPSKEGAEESELPSSIAGATTTKEKIIEGKKRVTIVNNTPNKSIPNNRWIPPTKTRSYISLKRGSNVDSKKLVKENGPKTAATDKLLEKKEKETIVVPTKDFDIVVHSVQPFTVFCLLVVDRGSGFSSPDSFESIRSRGRNLYLKCRMFWNNDTAKSEVCWNSINPSFRFQQLSPILVNDSLLERVQNNIMVIEVWDKKISLMNTKTTDDQLVGICKVPLHLFYLSYRDREVAKSLLCSQNAVIAANDTIPVVDLFSGRNVAHLEVLLASGTREQVEALRRRLSVPDVTRKRRTVEDRSNSIVGNDPIAVVTHIFTVTVDNLTLDVPPGSSIWAESDCYVQYLFINQTPVNDLSLGSVYLSVHRLNRVLCEPVMHWKSKTKHVVIQSSSSSIRNTLLGVCPRNGLPFQVWCKYYYPIEKDELVAEVFVPVATLCSLINDGHGVTIKLSLPLVANNPNLISDLTDPLRGEFSKLGTLNVEIGYECGDGGDAAAAAVVETRTPPPNTERRRSCPSVAPDSPPPVEKLDDNPCEPERDVQTFPASITIERAVHLRLLDNHHELNEMPNAYVSFVASSDAHFTNVIPKSDEPRWNWQMKVDLVSPQVKGSIEFEVCHAVDFDTTRKEGRDTVLGRASVDLAPLLLGFPQLCGWYNLINARSCCCGQIKVIIQPLCVLPMFRCRFPHPYPDDRFEVTDDCYLRTGSYAQFPSHIGQFEEQSMIRFHTEDPSSSVLMTKSVGGGGDDDDDQSNFDDKSRSFLMTNLKERLVELDNLFGHSSSSSQVVNEADLVIVPKSVLSDVDIDDGSSRYVLVNRTERVNPKTINVNCTKKEQDTTLNDESETPHLSVDQNGNGEGECVPRRMTRNNNRKVKRRIVADIFNNTQQQHSE